MSGSPEIPFDEAAEAFEEKVQELMKQYRAASPKATLLELRIAAEEMATTLLFPIEHQGRPN